MAIQKHRILIATDGSRAAEAALATAMKLPWPTSATARGIVSRSYWLPIASEQARTAVEKSYDAAIATAREALSRRWPKSTVVVADTPPADAILAEAERFKASTIVLGWRGHGTFRRLIAGSVSRTVAAKATCPVLIVREPPRAMRNFVVGFDGSANARRALDFLCSLQPKRGNRVVLVNVVTPIAMPTSVARFPTSMRAQLRQNLAAMNEESRQQGLAILESAAARLERRGWTVKSEVRVGAPLASLLEGVAEHRGDLLILGAGVTSGLQQMLIGSVANGALNNSPVLLLVP